MKLLKTSSSIVLCALALFSVECFLSPTGSKKEADNDQSTGSNVDSLFTVLVKQVQTMDTVQSYEAFSETDFRSLKNGFSAAAAKNPDNSKANVGLMVSTLMSLNTSRGVENLADSLDSYFSALDESSVEPVTPFPLGKRLMRKSFQKRGLIGLGKALAVKTPSLARAQTAKPSFPKFITLEYIQNIAEEEIGPALDTIISAAQRLEGQGDVTVPLVIEDEGESDTFELDKGEVYVAEALCRLARAFIGFFCAYDFDLYAPQTNDYRWIDSMVNSTTNDSLIITLSGDTLYRLNKYNDAGSQIYLANMFKYNLSRSDFLKIRRENHAQVKADLIAVADCIKNGIASIRTETDNQDNDIIKMSAINDADRDLVEFRGDLLDAGVSPALADNFSSPEKIAEFVKDLLSGPYQFNETIDSFSIVTKVNFAAWFDDPVVDLKTLLPKYKWTSENSWAVTKQNYKDVYSVFNRDSSFSVYDDGRIVSVKVPQECIVRIKSDEWGNTTYFLDRPIRYNATIDSSIYLDPLRLTDADGIEISSEQIDLQIDQKTFFPYFDDYTFHGLFPDLTTRQAWISMIYQ